MTDKEKLDLLERYVTILLDNRIILRAREDMFNKVERAYMDGEIDTLSNISNVIKNGLRKEKTDE